MAKASLKLENGTVVNIEGAMEEVQQLLAIYGGFKGRASTVQPPDGGIPHLASSAKNLSTDERTPDLIGVVNLIKSCDQADTIAKNILDKNSLPARIILPFGIVHEYMNNSFGLTSGEINKIMAQLGISISQPNASRTLSGAASKYLIGDKVRKNGQPVRYKLSRPGVAYFKGLLAGTTQT